MKKIKEKIRETHKHILHSEKVAALRQPLVVKSAYYDLTTNEVREKKNTREYEKNDGEKMKKKERKC